MRLRVILGFVVVALVASACGSAGVLNPTAQEAAGGAAQTSQATPRAGEYLVMFRTPNTLPAGAEQMIQRAGGAVERLLPQIGVAIARSDRSDFAEALRRESTVQRVAQDLEVQWIPSRIETWVAEERPGQSSVTHPTGAFFFPQQWNLRAIQAPEAWAAGHLGSPGVAVAVLDTGIDYTHLDLAGRVDLNRSKSFVPTDPVPAGAHEVADLHFHGTHVAGIIACNAVGTACVAPNATLIGVKVLNLEGRGTFAAVISGIVHAADVGADVINMSLGARFPRSCVFEDEEGNRVNEQPACATLIAALNRATNYAHSKGVLVISSAGNSATNADRNRDIIIVPAQSSNVVGVSATGPVNQENFDAMAFYTDYGFSLVDVAAPGGGGTPPPISNVLDAVISPCSSFSLLPGLALCRTSPPRYVRARGTSMAAPHAAGVAALIDSLAGGGMNGAQLRSRLQQSADDLGRVGRDEFYGMGRVNAFRATQ
ncbi:MAG: S8 family serine peptidase [Armatimonadota bacterium]|nr:S8 family serine peptidase [Armatimonadota bacterium]MDR5697355.1 S8 family serine peptidase [Armatimonadota bacterium]